MPVVLCKIMIKEKEKFLKFTLAPKRRSLIIISYFLLYKVRLDFCISQSLITQFEKVYFGNKGFWILSRVRLKKQPYLKSFQLKEILIVSRKKYAHNL